MNKKRIGDIIRECRMVLTGMFIFYFGMIFSFEASAQNLDFLSKLANPSSDVFLIKGDLDTIPVESPTRISIVDPGVADIVDAQDDGVLIVAKTPGETPLIIWENDKKRVVMIRVLEKNLDDIRARMDQLFEGAGITGVDQEVNTKEGKIILTGYLPEKTMDDFDKLIEPFSSVLVNLVKKQEVKDLLQIDMQVTELDSTLSRAMGIDWTPTAFTYNETMPEMDGSIGDFFKIGDFRRVTALTATVNALVSEGKARVLSQPKVVVVSGEQASFLVGGQVPVRTTTSTDVSSTENVTYKDYGVNMSITPTIKEKDKIDITLNVDISDIDASVVTSSDDIAFTTQNASTKLLLNDKQTIILAGLIKHNESQNISRVPFLSKVPIVGMVFRNKGQTTPTKDQELVISLTPQILEKNRSSKDKKVEQKSEEYSTTAVLTQKISSSTGAPSVKPYYLGIPRDMTDYVSLVQKKIAQAAVYPEEGRPEGWEGTAKLNMLILKDGTLAYAVVQDTSGYDSLDKAAVLAAKQVAPYDPFPAETNLQELNVIVPVVYRLRK